MTSEGKHNSSKDAEMEYKDEALLTHSLNSLINESGMTDQVSFNYIKPKNSASPKDGTTLRQRKRTKGEEYDNTNDLLTSNKILITDVNSPPTTHSPTITGSLISINNSILKNRYSEYNILF